MQSDTLREIAFVFYLTDSEDEEPLNPDGYTVKFNMLKPDNNFVMTTFTDGIIKLTLNMTAVTGTGYYCIMLMQDDEVIYSGNGKIVINDHVIGTENIDSVSEADGLVFPDDFYTRDTPIAEIDDTGTSDSSTWSSEKIAEEIASGSGADLIDDLTTSTTKTWSSSKISTEISAKTSINDNGITHTETWSSDKIATELNGKPDVDDTAQNYSDTWSSQKIYNEIQGTTHIADNAISSNTTWSSQKISDEISAITPGGGAYSTTEHTIGTWIDGSQVYEKTIVTEFTNHAENYDLNLSAIDGTPILLIDISPAVCVYIEGGVTYTQIVQPVVNNVNTSTIHIHHGNAIAETFTGYVTVRYVKTGGN